MSALPRRSAPRIALIWGLILALVVYGYSGVLLQIMGPMHRHADSVPLERSALLQAATDMAAAVGQWHDRLVSQALFVHERERFLPAARPDPAQARLHAHAHAHAHAHSHGLFERHHHEPGDASVVSLDGPAASGTAADALSATTALGSATLPMCTSPVLAVPDAAPCRGRWLHPAEPRWHNADLKLLERPPQA